MLEAPDQRALQAILLHLALWQFVSASLYALDHGGNDAQKTIGIIAALLTAHGKLPGEFYVPL